MMDRRQILSGGLGIGAGLAATTAGPRIAEARSSRTRIEHKFVPDDFGALPSQRENKTKELQKAINDAAKNQQILHLPAGTHMTGPLTLPANAQISGVPGETFLHFTGGACLSAKNVGNIRLEGLVLDGSKLPLSNSMGCNALLSLINVDQAVIRDCRFQNSALSGISIYGTSGNISNNEIMIVKETGIFSQDATGLQVSNNYVHDCGNNGIQVWRSAKGRDGTIISENRIERVRSDNGGSGQNGNGVNIYRAGGVTVANNVIDDCAYSAIRSNAGANCLMIGNNCTRLGEVALYAEFDFEGALIANNIVDNAASGISITNYNEGGRLAVVQGNLIRNLFTRDHYDSRGNGISAEADTLITGNTIENAPSTGISLGWGKFMRDVTASNNLIRNAMIGIGISTHEDAGSAVVTNNTISGAKNGAIRSMDLSKPIGDDLALSEKYVTGNIAVSGNIAV